MQDELNIEKFIVFKIADYLFGLSINDVLKVITCSLTDNRNLRTMGIVQLGQYMVKVLDFHQSLGSEDLTELPGEQSFLVITRNGEGELCGILVDEPPNLMELAQESLQIIPRSNHQSGMFQLVSHGAVISAQEGTITILVLDMKRTLSNAIPINNLLSLMPS
ncbi:chemotaxis protein CheW [Allocoleopsis franciscana]|uniref:Chemotaxis signal transduction protein n=1 Tax=Allocoleopsis franciscana PCC 7113 TaxID=1173027 RepID=K9WNU2_9CYAN|nr:chemotaxis protein CheW [Allocoleopsis franciscana]AFZ21476.1 chemotaxis signal transduction protein [Allocoleopsis franciscana PCC 7113]